MIGCNYFVLIGISLVVTCLTFGESATINTEKDFVNGVDLIDKPGERNSTIELRNCNFDTPCGWYIYEIIAMNGFGKIFKSFLLNKCKCKDETYRCIRTYENLSAQAYVYHCRQNSTNHDKVAPDHDIYSRNDDPYA